MSFLAGRLCFCLVVPVGLTMVLAIGKVESTGEEVGIGLVGVLMYFFLLGSLFS